MSSSSQSSRRVFNGTLDDTAKNVRLDYWRLFQEAEKGLAIASGFIGSVAKSMELHRKHCRKHPKDAAAAKRLVAIIARHSNMETSAMGPRILFLAARKSYLEKVLDLMGFDHDLLQHRHLVNIVDGDGSVRVGNPASEIGFYEMLYADGTQYRIITA